jgi:hypothetical protein
MVYIRVQPETPAFTLDKGDIYERLHYLEVIPKSSFVASVTLPNVVTGRKLRRIRHFFTDELILFFEVIRRIISNQTEWVC